MSRRCLDPDDPLRPQTKYQGTRPPSLCPPIPSLSLLPASFSASPSLSRLAYLRSLPRPPSPCVKKRACDSQERVAGISHGQLQRLATVYGCVYAVSASMLVLPCRQQNACVLPAASASGHRRSPATAPHVRDVPRDVPGVANNSWLLVLPPGRGPRALSRDHPPRLTIRMRL